MICLLYTSAILIGGAYHVWMSVTHGLSKLFHQTEEPHIKKWSGIIIAVTILLMAAPLIIPTALFIKEIIGGLYILYVGTFLVHAYNFFSRHWKPSDKPSDKK